MVKALNRVISQQTKLNPRGGQHFFAPSKEYVDALAESAGGDIRSAVNSLQFACSKGVSVQTNELSVCIGNRCVSRTLQAGAYTTVLQHVHMCGGSLQAS